MPVDNTSLLPGAAADTDSLSENDAAFTSERDAQQAYRTAKIAQAPPATQTTSAGDSAGISVSGLSSDSSSAALSRSKQTQTQEKRCVSSSKWSLTVAGN